MKKRKYKLEEKLGKGCFIVSYLEDLYCLKCQKIFKRKIVVGIYTTEKILNPKCNYCNSDLKRKYEIIYCEHCKKITERT